MSSDPYGDKGNKLFLEWHHILRTQIQAPSCPRGCGGGVAGEGAGGERERTTTWINLRAQN